MPDTPYFIQCKKCKRWFRSSNQRRQKCSKCLSKKFKYPRMFYYRKHFAYARDKFVCQLCKKDLKNEPGKNPPVHHADGNIKNNALENLVTLCSSCHKKIHSKYTKRQLRAYGKKMFPLQKYTVKELAPVKKRKPLLFTGI